MAISRKTALKRLGGLSAQVEEHLAKIAENPASAGVPYWQGEIRSWLSQMEAVMPNVGKKTGREWSELIGRWRATLGGR